MRSTTHQLPVILLLGKRRANHDEVDRWLAESRYSTCETTNVFQALEEISDFTVSETPDVVYLHADKFEAELAMLENMLTMSSGDLNASVIAFSDQEAQLRSDHNDSGVGALARQLERLIPQGPQVN